MRLRVAVFGTLGALATLVAAVFVVAPEVLLAVGPVEAVVGQLSGLDPTLVMLVATLVVGLYVAVAARSSPSERTVASASSAERRFDAAVTDPPEAVTADRRTLTAADVDADVDRAVASGGARLGAVRDALTGLVVEAYARRYQVRRAQARDVVASGDWTDDRVAAAFLGAEEGPQASLLSRVRLWLTPERERERRIRRTLAAATALTEETP